MPDEPNSTSKPDEATAAPEPPIPLRDYFKAFIGGNRVILNDYACHAEICDAYEAAFTGTLVGIDYVLVHMPRRTGKTKILEALPTWVFGEFDGAQMLYGSYTEPLVKRTIRYVAATMQRAWYKDLYGDLIHTKSANLVTTVGGGTLYGAGTTATVVGYGAGLKEPAGGFIGLDDPSNADAVFSKVESKKVIDNFENTWKGCRNSDRWTPILVNAQRLGPDDLPGYIHTTYPNRTLILKFPAFHVPGWRSKPSSEADAVPAFPDTWGLNTLADLKKTRLGRYVLASQFQQEPIALGGNLIPIEKFQRYDWASARATDWEQIVITVDTAMKIKEANDYSCAQAWGLKERRAYLIDQVHGKWESPELLANVVTFMGKVKADFPMCPIRCLVEEKAAGTGLIQQMHAAGVPAEGIERAIDKVQRVQGVLPFIESGLVFVPKDEGGPAWLAGFLQECAAFKPDGTHAHDDRVDTMVDGVETLLGKGLSILDVLGLPNRGRGRR